MITVKINIRSEFLKVINNYKFVLLFLFILIKINLYSQNLYDLDHSAKYASFLYSTNQFKLAAEEYERLVFLDTANTEFKIKLISSYRKSNNLKRGIERIHQIKGGDIYNMNNSLSYEYLALLMRSDSLSGVDDFLKKNVTLSEKKKSVVYACNLLLYGSFRNAGRFIGSEKNDSDKFPVELVGIVSSAKREKFKSPFLAASLSTVIPGTGKVYTGDYLDGLISLLFVAGNTWQSYQGFKKNGIKSASGWIFGGIAAGFYIGNIHGSAKAAKRYNKRKIDETRIQVYDFLDNYNF